MLPPNFLKWAALVVIGIVAISVLIFFISREEKSPDFCNLQLEEPKLDSKLTNVAGSNDTCLANFRGYFVYEKSSSQPTTYLPLHLHYLAWMKSNSLEQLSFDLTCATISLRIVHSTDGNYASAAILYLHDPQDKTISIQCEMESFDTIDYDKDERYSCHRQKTYRCLRYLPESIDLIGKLVVNDLEYEANGKPKKISRGEFSKTAVNCKKEGSLDFHLGNQ